MKKLLLTLICLSLCVNAYAERNLFKFKFANTVTPVVAGWNISTDGAIAGDTLNATGSGTSVFIEDVEVGGDITTTGTAFLGLIDLGTNTIDDGSMTGDWDMNNTTLTNITTATIGTANVTTLDLGTNTITDGNLTGSWTSIVNLTATGTITGEQITSTDDMTMAGFFLNTLTATDEGAFRVNGTTNPYSGTNSFNLFDLSRGFAGQVLGGGQEFKGFKTNLSINFDVEGLDEGQIVSTVMENTSSFLVDVNSGDYADWALLTTGLKNTISMLPRFNVADVANEIILTGVEGIASYQGLYFARNASPVTVYGSKILANSSPSEVTGFADQLVLDIYGLHVSAAANGKGGTENLYALYVANAGGAVTSNWAYYNASSADNFMGDGETQISGDLVFNDDGSGIPFGGIFAEDGAGTVVLGSQDTFVQVLVFDTNGENNLTTPDHTNDHITISKTGRYFMIFSTSFFSNTANEYDFHIRKNNGTVDFPQTSGHRTTSIASATGNCGGQGIADLTAGDTIELWVERLDGGGVSKTITIPQVSLTIGQWGG